MGKQKKCSKSNHGSKKHRPKLVQGSFGKARVEDSFDSSRTRFRSAISSLKDVDFDLSDQFSSSGDEGDSFVSPSPLMLASVPQPLPAESGSASGSHVVSTTNLLSDGILLSPTISCANNSLAHDANSWLVPSATFDENFSNLEGPTNLLSDGSADYLSPSLSSVGNVKQLACEDGKFSNLEGPTPLAPGLNSKFPTRGVLSNEVDCLARSPPTPIHFGDFGSTINRQPLGSSQAALPSKSLDLLKHHKVRLLDDLSTISIPSEISQIGVNTWAASIVGYFVGGKKSIQYATFWAKRLWGDKVSKVFYNGNGFYIFCFKTESDISPIIDLGHAFFGQALILLQKWQPTTNLTKRALSKVPIWLKLYNVPLTLWHEDGIAYLASYFGRPLYLDEATKSGNKLSFARVCVEIEATTIIPSSISVQVAGCDIQTITIDIPWKPSKCMHCKAFGHSDSNCSSKPREQKIGAATTKVKSKFEWKEVTKQNEKASDPPVESVAPTKLETPLGNGQAWVATPVKPTDPPKCKAPSPGNSSNKRVHFDKTAVLLDKTNIAKEEALSTISFPALKSCLKVHTGRKALRLVENEPP